MEKIVLLVATLALPASIAQSLTPITTTPRNVMSKTFIMGGPRIGLTYKDAQGYLFVNQD